MHSISPEVAAIAFNQPVESVAAVGILLALSVPYILLAALIFKVLKNLK